MNDFYKCPVENNYDRLNMLSDKERIGCVVLWLNALYSAEFYRGCCSEEIDFDAIYPCSYCPYSDKCPSKASEKHDEVPLPLIFSTALEHYVGRGTVINGGFPSKEFLRDFLEHKARLLVGSSDPGITDTDIQDN